MRPTPLTDRSATRVYCSGPLFCAEEIGGMTALARVLEAAGMTVFLPHRDGLEPFVVPLAASPLPALVPGLRERVDRAVFALDVYQLLERCDAVVCSLNGRVPDEGMIVEASLAFAAGVPLVLYKQDARAPFGGRDNAMLTSLTRGPIADRLDQLPALVQARLGERRPGPRPPLSVPLEQAIVTGRRIAAVLARLPAQLGQPRWSDAVVAAVLDEVT